MWGPRLIALFSSHRLEVYLDVTFANRKSAGSQQILTARQPTDQRDLIFCQQRQIVQRWPIGFVNSPPRPESGPQNLAKVQTFSVISLFFRPIHIQTEVLALVIAVVCKEAPRRKTQNIEHARNRNCHDFDGWVSRSGREEKKWDPTEWKKV